MNVTSFRELMREQANAAVRVSGAHHSSWNGRFGPPIARQSNVGGTANWDNSISYNPRHVDERLREMFRNARTHNQDKAVLRAYRDAIRIVLHENVHLLSSAGREFAQSYAAMANGPGVRQFEEGVTELYSHQKLDEYIDDLGLDQVAPGIKDVRSAQVYKEFTPAVEGFAETLERQSGVPRDELIGRLAVVPADQKFRVAAEAMYDNSRLPGLLPPDQRDQAVGQIARAMGAKFAEVSKLPASADAGARRAVGLRAAVEGSKVISRLKKQWQMPAPGQQVQRVAGAEQGRGAQPDQGAQRDRGAQPGRDGNTRPSPAPGAAPAGPDLPPDAAAAARAGLSGPPLASVSRLRAGQQGARGTGSNTPAAHRPGPETQR